MMFNQVPEWIGTAPKDWELKKIKHLFNDRVEKNTTGNSNYLSLLKDIGIVLYSEKGNAGNKTSDTPENYKMVYVDDIVVNPMNVMIGSVGRSNYDGCLSSVYIVLEPKEDTHSRFYHHVFSVKEFQKYLRRISSGIMEIRESVDKGEFFSEKLPYPSKAEQIKISNFLDKKTVEIDDLIQKIEKNISLLEEQKKSLIQELVTKGLNSQVEFKDSEIEWVGNTPTSWKRSRLGSLGTFSKGSNIAKDDLRSEGYPCILYSEIYTKYNRVISDVSSFVDEDKYQSSTKVQAGVFLFTSSGETKEDIGKCVLYSGNEEVALGGDMVIYVLNHPEKFDCEFLSYVFNANYFQSAKTANCRGEIIVHLYEKQLREMLFVYPELNEQKEISEYLNKKTTQINEMMTKELNRIELLKEYRRSIVSNVVTGKIRVTGENV
jgi:type I restriction enzyme S subunit